MYCWRAWVVLGLLAASLATGCGGDDGGGDSAATEWADDVCSAITSWSESVAATTESLQSGSLGEEALRSAVDDLQSATSDFVDDVRQLEAPDTGAGEEAKESLDQLADDADKNLSTIQSAVNDVSGLSGVVEALTAISAAVSTMSQELSSTFTELEQLDGGGELEAAFNEAGSCDELQSG